MIQCSALCLRPVQRKQFLIHLLQYKQYTRSAISSQHSTQKDKLLAQKPTVVDSKQKELLSQNELTS